MEANIIYNIDCLTGLRNLPDDSIDCCVTSPPYFNLRDYGVSGQIGLEDTPEQYIQKLVGVFHEVRRVRHTLDAGLCVTGGRLVSAAGYYLGKA